jgi:DNA-binding PadR family transcriptional regulator
VRATDDLGRNNYQITPEGRAFLEESSALIGDILSRMEKLGRAQASASPVIVAAMDNLKSALRGGTEPWTELEARHVAAAIDEAAGQVRELRDGADETLQKTGSRRRHREF